jgi:hypothetical protein
MKFCPRVFFWFVIAKAVSDFEVALVHKAAKTSASCVNGQTLMRLILRLMPPTLPLPRLVCAGLVLIGCLLGLVRLLFSSLGVSV